VLSVFVNVVLPVFIVAGMGFAVQRRFHPSISALTQTALYIMLPSLLFTSLLKVDLRSQEPLRILAFTLLLTAVMLVIALVIGRAAKLDRVTTSALMLTVAFPNLGNYGLPVVFLAFGESGLAIALVLIALQSLYGTTLSIFLASSGSMPLAAALGQVLRQPTIYAVAAALVVNLAQLQLPDFILAALTIPAQAAIPLMVIILGMQLAGTRGIEAPRLVGAAVFTRLVLGPIIGVGLAILLGLTGVTRDVMIVGAAMPSAVFTIVMATEFNARPRLVSDVVIASTLASIVTVTAVVSLLLGKVSLL
jgi:malate permease and related proteins